MPLLSMMLLVPVMWTGQTVSTMIVSTYRHDRHYMPDQTKKIHKKGAIRLVSPVVFVMSNLELLASVSKALVEERVALLDWVNGQLEAFEYDMGCTEDLDYAYAHGAFEAYSLLVKKLLEEVK